MNNVAIKEKDVKSILTTLVDKGKNSFPDGINAERLRINALMYIHQDQKLLALANKNPMRIAQYIYNFIALGLDMLNRECYLIPYGEKITVIRDYKGEVKLAKKYSVDPIKNIYSRCVYSNDSYSFENETFIHSFDPFNTDRGTLIGAYCKIVFANGGEIIEFVNNDEIEKVKSVSQSAKSEYSPWQKWTEEMYKKTAIRKALKLVSLDFGNADIQRAYKESDNDIKEDARGNSEVVIEQKDVLTQPENDIEDAEYEEIDF